MRDSDCVAFLQWALPRLRLRWPGYRRVRRQVCKRIQRRIDALDVTLGAYRERIAADPAERARLDAYCRITISSFYRDRGTWRCLEREALPRLAREADEAGRDTLRAWTVGCASGEEPYTLALLWGLELSRTFAGTRIDILATDNHPALLARAERACYARGSLKELPKRWRRAGFVIRDGQYCLRSECRMPVRLLLHDVRDAPPEGPFDVILCRNLAFTYFEPALQRHVLDRLMQALRPNGLLVLGAHESPPEPHPGWERAGENSYRLNQAPHLIPRED